MAELQDYKDLIYTRLDLPNLPFIDVALLLQWLNNKARLEMVEKELHNYHTKTQLYPWKAVIVCRHNVWEPSFIEVFPEIVQYTKHFPCSFWRQISILSQLPDKEVFLHTDPDEGLGWRLYLSKGGPRLYFQKFHKRWERRPQTWALGGPAAMQQLCTPEKLYVDDTGCYPWALTTTRAAHGVSKNFKESDPRISMLLFPDPNLIDQSANLRLLQQSVDKYHKTAIWY